MVVHDDDSRMTMFASLVKAMARVAVRMGFRRRKPKVAAPVVNQLAEKQELQCPVCNDRSVATPH